MFNPACSRTVNCKDAEECFFLRKTPGRCTGSPIIFSAGFFLTPTMDFYFFLLFFCTFIILYSSVSLLVNGFPMAVAACTQGKGPNSEIFLASCFSAPRAGYSVAVLASRIGFLTLSSYIHVELNTGFFRPDADIAPIHSPVLHRILG